MPFSSLHYKKKSRLAKKKISNELCPCKLCKGKKFKSSKVINRHLEAFGQSKDPVTGVEDNDTSCSSASETDGLSATSLSPKRPFPAEKGSNGTFSASDAELSSYFASSSQNLRRIDQDPSLDVVYSESSSEEPHDLLAIEDSESDQQEIEEIDDFSSESSTEETDIEECNNIYSSDRASLPLYEGSDITVLQALAGYFEWFTEHPATSKSALTDLLALNKRILPFPNNLPNSYEEAHQFIRPFLLPTKVYHACQNDCILFRKTARYDYSKEKFCPVCGAARYQSGCKPVRKFIYYPLGPRWKRMYGN